MVTSEYAWYSSPERVLRIPENVSVTCRSLSCHTVAAMESEPGIHLGRGCCIEPFVN